MEMSFYTCAPRMTIIIMMYGSWDMECDRQTFSSFWTTLPFYPTNNPKNLNFEKNKKMPGDIIILHTCTINENHMMYGSWDIECDIIFFVILEHFSSFYPLTTQKIKILKTDRNAWRYHAWRYQKLLSDDVWSLKYGVLQTNWPTEKVIYRGGI